MPRTTHSLASELLSDHQISAPNNRWEQLAAFIEAAQDQEATLKLLREDRELVIDIITKE
jgi:hypothetical protein